MSGIAWTIAVFSLYLFHTTLLATATDVITAIQSNNRCYWLYNLTQNFYTANTTCSSTQKELALFDDNKEFDDVVTCLRNYFNRSQIMDIYVWIDFRKLESCSQFSWKNEQFRNTNIWGNNNPNQNCKPNCDLTSCCARLKWDSSGFQKLRDHNCDVPFNFICKAVSTMNNCTTKDNNLLKSFLCPCGVGYKLSTVENTCEDVDECQNSTKPCDQICVNNPGSFTCGCQVGYILNNDSKTCSDINECGASKKYCSQNCTNTPGSYRCECYLGYNLTSDNITCLELDECVSSPCKYNCTNTPGSYHCTCPTGHTLSTNGTTCLDIDECVSSPCQYNCTNAPGSYHCTCPTGHTLSTNGTACLDIDECQNTSKCPGVCTNRVGSYFCGCDQGYQDINKRCVDVDECVGGQHNCSQACYNFDGGYNCSCYLGYTTPADNRFECHDIDECHDNNQTCQHNCINNNGSYYCTCNKGYNLDINNRSCHDIDECQLNTTICGHLCNNMQGSFFCSCRKGFKLDTDGHSCVTKITEKKCPCSCLFANRTNTTNLLSLQQKIREMIMGLKVFTRNTSLFTRSKTSAKDKRGSSETVGSFGGVIVALVLAVIFLPDWITAVKYLSNRMSKKN